MRIEAEKRISSRDNTTTPLSQTWRVLPNTPLNRKCHPLALKWIHVMISRMTGGYYYVYRLNLSKYNFPSPLKSSGASSPYQYIAIKAIPNSIKCKLLISGLFDEPETPCYQICANTTNQITARIYTEPDADMWCENMNSSALKAICANIQII